MDDEAKEVRDALTPGKEPVTHVVPGRDLLSTGSTQLNLACTDRIKGGFVKGKYVLLVGDSESGKTWFTMSCLAEASRNKEFKDYRFIYDGPEDGAMMDRARYFGQAVVDRIEAPDGTQDPVASTTLEDFYDYLDAAQNDGRPFIYVLDSENSLSPRAELKRIEGNKKARAKGTQEENSYGTDRAKIHSTRLRVVRNKLKHTGSILIVISQTRQTIGFGAQFNPKSRSGGTALKFFADLEIWTSIKGTLKKKVKGKDRVTGMIAQLQVKKNRVTGKKRKVLVPFLFDLGIDDVGGCVQYLIDEGHWKKSKGLIQATEFDVSLGEESLLRFIEDRDLEGKLRKVVGQVWKSIEEQTASGRKPRYQ